ncbi:proline-rich transmembrane protein 1 [Biomphalaria pfeifferi]|uniref:Proline-rich transmembrane protein 1 n=1 Tax=Biomphalaria pfeifferi TaxID=112525 RepID=A0AAD8F6C4_BIOPF|nr:proline-rich transmembrane protein 1 [Biomphalaria pfeifferi]
MKDNSLPPPYDQVVAGDYQNTNPGRLQQVQRNAEHCQAYPPTQPGYPHPPTGYTSTPMLNPNPPQGCPQAGYPPPAEYNQQSQTGAQLSVQNINNIITTDLPYHSHVNFASFKDYMPAAILVAVVCFCCPTSFIAVLRASDARRAMSRGDEPAAMQYSRSARCMIIVSAVGIVITFSLIAIVIGLVIS